MEEEETLDNFNARFSDIPTLLSTQDEQSLSEEKNVENVLTFSPNHFQYNVTTIKMTFDFDSLKIHELDGDLHAYEICHHSQKVKKLLQIRVKEFEDY